MKTYGGCGWEVIACQVIDRRGRCCVDLNLSFNATFPTLAFKISADLDIAMPNIFTLVWFADFTSCKYNHSVDGCCKYIFPPRVSFHSGAAAGCSEPFLHRVGHCQQGLDRSVSGVKGTCAETFLKLKEPV